MDMRFGHRTTQWLVAVAVALLALALVAPAGAEPPATPALTPPLPANATDVRCTTGGSGTVCHFDAPRAGTLVPYFPPGVTCEGGFIVLATFEAEGDWTRFYDAAGAMEREIRHVSFTGSLHNSVTLRSLPYLGHFTRTEHVATATAVITGLRFRVGDLTVDAGRTVTVGGEEVFKAGPGGTAENLAVICVLLR